MPQLMIPGRLIAAGDDGVLVATRFDYYVNAATGSDSNDGLTPATAWATLTQLRTTVNALAAGTAKTAYVSAATYTDQHLAFSNSELTPVQITVTFEAGTALVWNSIASPGDGIGASGTIRVTAYGNGTTITGYSPGSGNGLGCRNTAYLEAHDFVIDNADDGCSNHTTGEMRVYDCTFRNCTKGAFTHINDSTSYHYRCTFEGRTSATLGIGDFQNNAVVYFEDCIFAPASAGQGVGSGVPTGTAEFVRCRLGTLSTRVSIAATSGGATLTDCFVNATIDGNTKATLTGCYGYLTTRMRNAGIILLDGCIFTNGATGDTDSALHANFDPGSQGSWDAIDTIFTGYSTAIGSGFTATYAGYFTAAGNSVNYCCLFGNTTNFDSDLTGADITTGNITTDPLIGAGGTYVKSDWGYATGSPCIGAGSGGGNIGFAA
jgi:hypothetical protein